MTVDRGTAIAVTNEIDELIAAVFEKHGLRCEPSKTKYGHDYVFTVTATRVLLDENGIDRGTPHASAWLTLGEYEIRKLYGYDKDMPFTPGQALGVVFESRGQRFRFEGMNPRGRTYPLVAAEVVTGKRYKFPLAALRNIGRVLEEVA